MVVLLVEQVFPAGRAHHVVDAVADLAVARRGGMVVTFASLGVGQSVTPLPGRAAVLGGEDARSRDADPKLLRIGRVGEDGVQHQPCRTGIPASGRGVVGQTLDPLPGLATIVARQKSSRLRPRVKRAVRTAQRPYLRDRAGKRQFLLFPADHRGKVCIVRGPVIHLTLAQTRDLPAFAAIGRPPDTRAMPFAAAAGPNRASAGVADDVIDRPAATIRTANGPAAAIAAAGNQKGTLGGADENREIRRRHFRPLPATRADATTGLIAD